MTQRSFKHPENFDLGLAYRCSLRCRTCLFWQHAALDERSVLSAEEWISVLDQIAAFAPPDAMVNISGPGEVFERNDVFRVIEHGLHRHIKLNVITNGMAVSDNVIYKIGSLGLRFLTFSLDSLDPILDLVSPRAPAPLSRQAARLGLAAAPRGPVHADRNQYGDFCRQS